MERLHVGKRTTCQNDADAKIQVKRGAREHEQEASKAVHAARKSAVLSRSDRLAKNAPSEHMLPFASDSVLL